MERVQIWAYGLAAIVRFAQIKAKALASPAWILTSKESLNIKHEQQYLPKKLDITLVWAHEESLLVTDGYNLA